MTHSDLGDLQVFQRQVQEKLGRCMLKLQGYESLLKAILTTHEFSATSQTTNLDARAAQHGGKTLGTLVKQLLGSFLIPEEQLSSPNEPTKDQESGPTFSFRTQIAIPVDEFAKIEADLKSFVSLRNDLVHQFLAQHDLKSCHGCQMAEQALNAASTQIDRHLDNLRAWAEDLDRCRQSAFELMQSAVIKDWIVSGDFPLRFTTIVHALDEAAAELSEDGWAPLAKAVNLIALRYPEELPINYGRSSWRQLLREPGLFELRQIETNRQKSAWYRTMDRVGNN